MPPLGATRRPVQHLSRRGGFGDGRQSCGHGLDGLFGSLAQPVSFRDLRPIVVAEPDLAVRIFPSQRLQRKVNAGALPVLHQQRAALRTAEGQSCVGRNGIPNCGGAAP